jgi:hypothetical protein
MSAHPHANGMNGDRHPSGSWGVEVASCMPVLCADGFEHLVCVVVGNFGPTTYLDEPPLIQRIEQEEAALRTGGGVAILLRRRLGRNAQKPIQVVKPHRARLGQPIRTDRGHDGREWPVHEIKVRVRNHPDTLTTSDMPRGLARRLTNCETSIVLLTRPALDSIVAGDIDLVFRRWRKPTVKAGGRLRTVVGVLAIEAIDIVEADAIDDAQAARAGFDSAAVLVHDLLRERATSGRARTAKVDETSQLYRVRVSFAGPDDRIERREQLLAPNELKALSGKLAAMDARSTHGPWTRRTLELIATWPARRAPELAEMHGYETLPWKAQVRRLKELGLTESLPVGYQLSPRGQQVFEAL